MTYRVMQDYRYLYFGPDIEKAIATFRIATQDRATIYAGDFHMVTVEQMVHALDAQQQLVATLYGVPLDEWTKRNPEQ